MTIEITSFMGPAVVKELVEMIQERLQVPTSEELEGMFEGMARMRAANK